MTPTVYDGTVLVSTIPGNTKAFYAGNGDGIVYALDAQTGATKWRFNTISDGARLWGDARVNSGGGLWYPAVGAAAPGPYVKHASDQLVAYSLK